PDSAPDFAEPRCRIPAFRPAARSDRPLRLGRTRWRLANSSAREIMEQLGPFPSRHGLEQHGLHGLRRVFWNLSPAQLHKHAITRGEGRLSSSGTLVALTGSHTGRSP